MRRKNTRFSCTNLFQIISFQTQLSSAFNIRYLLPKGSWTCCPIFRQIYNEQFIPDDDHYPWGPQGIPAWWLCCVYACSFKKNHFLNLELPSVGWIKNILPKFCLFLKLSFKCLQIIVMNNFRKFLTGKKWQCLQYSNFH